MGSRRRQTPQRRKVAKTADETVETIGHNSELPLPQPDDWNHHKKTIAGYKEKVTTASGLLRNAIKQAKKSGIDMDAMNLVTGLELKNDPNKALNFFQQIDLGLSLGETTLRVTPTDSLMVDTKDAAYERGVRDGKAGRTPEGKYPEGSDLALDYTRGWQHGTGANMGLKPQDTDAAINGPDTANNNDETHASER